MKQCEEFVFMLCIHAGMERICHTCVTNAFDICDEFVRILHTCENYEV